MDQGGWHSGSDSDLPPGSSEDTAPVVVCRLPGAQGVRSHDRVSGRQQPCHLQNHHAEPEETNQHRHLPTRHAVLGYLPVREWASTSQIHGSHTVYEVTTTLLSITYFSFCNKCVMSMN